MKINLRSIIITVVIILLASNICIGIFYVNKYEKFKVRNGRNSFHS